jgi:hypothetical protein
VSGFRQIFFVGGKGFKSPIPRHYIILRQIVLRAGVPAAWGGCPSPIFPALFLALILAAGPGCSTIDHRPDGRGDFAFHAESNLLYGAIDGFLQTPRGGAPGTTSIERPAFTELGIDAALGAEAGFGAEYEGHAAELRARFFPFSSSATLASPLTSWGVAYPAGARVDADVALFFYSIDYEYRFILWDQPQAPGGGLAGRWSVAPAVAFMLFDFDYSLSAAGGLASSRAYTTGTLMAGAETIVTFGDSRPFGLRVRGLVSAPFTNLFAVTAEARATYRLWGDGLRGVSGLAGVGVAWQYVDYKDGQAVPNHVRVELGPMVEAGIDIRF